MSLQRPEKIRTLQRRLYGKAKASCREHACGVTPEFRFHQLYDKVWRDDVLAHAHLLARENRGAPGAAPQSQRRRLAVVVGRVVKPVGAPDAGEPHVRFDERGEETGQAIGAGHRLPPRRSSTLLSES
jgi:hypothetical protein